MVLESEMLVEKDGRYALARPFQPLSIPDTLHETLMARMARLTTAKPVALAASTIGREFDASVLRVIGGFDEQTVARALDDLIGAGLLYRRGLQSRARYIFKHALVQEALYQSLLESQRREYHGRIAAILVLQVAAAAAQLQPELVAWHYEESGQAAEAVEYWTKAADLASNRGAYREAVNHVRHALGVLESLAENEERWSAELALRVIEAPALVALENWVAPLHSDCYRRARELCRVLPPDRRLFAVLRGMWSGHLVNASLNESLAVASELLDMAKAANDDDMAIEGHATTSTSLYYMGRLSESLEHKQAVFALYDIKRHHVPHGVAYGEDPAFGQYGFLTSHLSLMGRIREADDWMKKGLALLESGSHQYSCAMLQYCLTLNAVMLRDYETTQKYAEKLLAMATEHQFGSWLLLGHLLRGWAVAGQGDIEAGVAESTEVMRMWFASGAKLGLHFFTALIADVELRAGRLEQAEKWVAEGLEGSEQSEDRYFLSELYRIRAEIFAARGNDEQALQWFAIALAEAWKSESKLFALRTATGMARLHIRRGEHAAAPAALEPFTSMLEEEPEVADTIEAAALAAQFVS